MDINKKIGELGFVLPPVPAQGGIYTPVREFCDNLYYVSGCGPNISGGESFFGKVGKEYSLEDGQRAAQMATLNMLATMEKHLGDLSRVKKIVKLLCFVASDNDFHQQPKVANAASALLTQVFGEEVGLGARSAIGVNVLPDNIPFEIEVLFEVHS